MLNSLKAPFTALPEVRSSEREVPREALSLRFIVDTIRRRRLALAICLAGTLAAAAAYAFTAPNKYAATTTLLIDSRLAQLSQTDATATVVDQAAVESQIELLRSEKLLATVIDKLGLVDDPEFAKRAAKDPSDPAAAAEILKRRAIASMTANLWASRVGRSYLVSVAFNSADAVKSARIANEVSNAYIADQIGAKVQAAKDQNAWLDSQVNEMRSRAAQAYRTVADFKASHDINPFREFAARQDMDRLTAEKAQQRTTATAAKAALDRTQAQLAALQESPTPTPDVAALHLYADPALESLLTRYATATADPGAPAADAQDPNVPVPGVAAVTRDIELRLQEIATQRRVEWEKDSAQQQATEVALSDIQLRDTQDHLVQERLRELETEAATSRSLYESYLNQLTHAAQQQPVPASDARVISPASVPLLPTSPKKLLILLLAGMAGVALGLATVFVLESLDDVIRTRGRLESVTHLPCIGIVPRTRRWGSTSRQLPLPERLENAFPRLLSAGARSKAVDVLRGLQLAAYGDLGSKASIVGVTSAVAGEGKTTVALNLALSAGRAGRRVLLIDCNLRNPTLTRLAVAADPKADVSDCSGIVTVSETLDVAAASAALTIEGAELPDVQLLRTLLEDAKAAYDLVVVDLPAILPLSELRSVAHLIDLSVLVTRWGSTTTAQLDRALKRLGDDDQNVVGIVMNGVRLRTMRRFEGSTSRSYA